MAGPSQKVSELIKEGLMHFRNENLAHARACWEVALELDPDNLHLQKYLQLFEYQSDVNPTQPLAQEDSREQEKEDREIPTFEEIASVGAIKPRA